MRAYHQVTKLVFVFLALVATATAVILPGSSGNDRDSSPGTGLFRRQHRTYTYWQLANGELQNANYRPMHHLSRDTFYHKTLFIDNRPLYLLHDQSKVVRGHDAQQALTDYGGFHAHLTGTDHVVTVTPTGAVSANSDVVQGAKQAHETRRIYGENVAILAHGSGVNSLPPRKSGLFSKSKPKVPSWEQVWSSESANPSQDFSVLKNHLDNQRVIRFENSERTVSLGVRAKPDGTVEHALYDMMKGKHL